MKTKTLQKGTLLIILLAMLTLWIDPLAAQNKTKDKNMQNEKFEYSINKNQKEPSLKALITTTKKGEAVKTGNAKYWQEKYNEKSKIKKQPAKGENSVSVKTNKTNDGFGFIPNFENTKNQTKVDEHIAIKNALFNKFSFNTPSVNTNKSVGAITGYAENFDDDTLTNWWNDTVFVLTEANAELKVDVDKDGWVAFGLDFTEAVNMTDNPYLYIRLKTDTDVNVRTSFIDENGTWADGNNNGFDVTTGNYQEFFMDFSNRWYNWQNIVLNDSAITGLGFSINFGNAYTGTIYIDDILIGDQATLPTGDLTLSVNMNYYIDEGLFDSTADFVDVMGSFDNWTAGSGAMDDSDGDGIYSYTLNSVTYNDTIEYKFRMNGDWGQPHDFPGGPNRKHVFTETTELLSWFNDEYIDIKPLWFNEPSSSCSMGDEEPVAVLITNLGTDTVNGFNIGLKLDGQFIAEEFADIRLNPGDTAEYYFNAVVDLYTEEFEQFFELKTYTILANDYISDNDTNTWNKRVYGNYDDPTGWEIYTVCDGLPHRSVWSIAEGGDGSMYFGTFWGVLKINDTVQEVLNDENVLGNSYAWAMYADSKGNVWFPGANDGTITMFDGTDYFYYYPDAQFEECLFEDEAGNMWFGSWDYKGLAKFDGTNFTYYTTADGLLSDRVISISQEQGGNLLVATESGVSQFDGTTWSEYPVNGNTGQYIPEIYTDSQGRIWFSGNNLFMFDGANWFDFTTDDSIPGWIDDIDEDIYGNVWFGGGTQLSYYDGTNWYFYGQEDGLLGNIYALEADQNGDIWIGVQDVGVQKLYFTSNYIGFVENFDDGDIEGWTSETPITLTNTGTELQMDIDKTDWQDVGFGFPKNLDLTENPYLSLRIKSVDNVEMWVRIAENGINSEGNLPTLQITGDTVYHDYFIDYSETLFNSDGAEVDISNIEYMLINTNQDQAYTGTIYIDDIMLGNKAQLPYYDVTFNVNMNYLIDKGAFDPLVDSVDIAGSFNNWNGSGAMDDSDGDGIYSQTFTFQHGEYIEYKFRKNSDWNQLHDFPNGGPNRTYLVTGYATLEHWFNDEYSDIQVIWFDEPSGSCDLGSTAPVAVQVLNSGSDTVSGFDIGLSVDSVEIAVEFANLTINPGDTAVYTFNASVDLYHNDFSRSYLLQAYTLYNMDYIPENDINTWNKFVYGDYDDLPDWTTYTICDGLLDWSVFAMEEDKAGNIWASGFKGVSVFDGTSWSFYNSENGLAVDYVWTMLKDSHGNIWLPGATDSIVSVFDGTNFTYHHLNAIYEECIYEDEAGNIWIGSWGYNGVAMYNGSVWTYYTTDDGLLGNRIISISSDADSNVLIASDGGVSIFNGTNWSEYLVNGESGTYVNEIFKDSQNRLWFMGSPNLMYNGSAWTNFTETDTITQWLEQADEDIYGNIWLTGGSSLFKYDSTWTEYTPDDGMVQGGWNFDVLADSKGNIWVGSYRGGLSKFSQTQFADVTLNVNMNVQTELGLFNPDIDFVDVAGTFNNWSGSEPLNEIDSSGVYTITISGLIVGDTIEYKFRKNASWDNNSHEFPDGGPNRVYLVVEGENIVDHWYNDMDSSVFNKNIGITNLSIANYCQPTSTETVTISVENEGSEPVSQFTLGIILDGIEVASDTVSLNINPGETVDYTLSSTVDLYTTDFSRRYYFTAYVNLEDDYVVDNDTLFANIRVYGDYTNPEGWDSYTECNGLLHSGVFSLAEDSQNRIWAAGFKGLSVFNGSTWEHFNSENGLPADYYWAITNDNVGNIWMASVGDSSIVKYDGTSFSVYETEGEFVECIYVDADGNIWAGSWYGAGLAKFDGTSWTYYSVDDGLLDNTVVSIAQNSEGNMLFATAAGVSKFDGTTWSELPVNGAIGTWVTEIYLDSNNRLWMSNDSLYMFDGTTWTNYTELNGINGNIQDIDEGPSGEVWFGEGQTVSIFSENEWTVFSSENDGIVDETYIYALQIDAQGDAWFGTYPTGLFKYDVQYPVETSVTFNYNMNQQIEVGNFVAGTDFVDIAGTFNNWSGELLSDSDTNGIYSLTITNVAPDDTIEFKARINGNWNTSEFPNGGANRTYVVLEGDNVLDFWYNNEYPENVEIYNTLLSHVNVYPVPSEGIINVYFSDITENYTMEIINGNGQLIVSRKVDVFPGLVEQFDLSNEKAGIYLIRVFNENDNVIKRVIKQ